MGKTIAEELIDQGRKKGRKEEALRARRQILLELLRERFGVLPRETVAAIESRRASASSTPGYAASPRVGVAEQGGRDLISVDPLAPGSIYAAAVTADATVGLYRLEVGVSNGNGRLKAAGGVSGTTKESIQRAYGYLNAHKTDLGLGREVDGTIFMSRSSTC